MSMHNSAHTDVTNPAGTIQPRQVFCGGCGATDSSQRCIGCLHVFVQPAGEVITQGRALVQEIELYLAETELVVSKAIYKVPMNQEATNIYDLKAERDALAAELKHTEECSVPMDAHAATLDEVTKLAAENKALREAAQLAMDALDTCKETMTGTRFRYRDYDERRVASAKAALKEAIE